MFRPDLRDKPVVALSNNDGSVFARSADYVGIHQAIFAYSERAAEKLGGEKQYSRQIVVFLRTSPHAENEAVLPQPGDGVIAHAFK